MKKFVSFILSIAMLSSFAFATSAPPEIGPYQENPNNPPIYVDGAYRPDTPETRAATIIFTKDFGTITPGMTISSSPKSFKKSDLNSSCHFSGNVRGTSVFYSVGFARYNASTGIYEPALVLDSQDSIKYSFSLDTARLTSGVNYYIVLANKGIYNIDSGSIHVTT